MSEVFYFFVFSEVELLCFDGYGAYGRGEGGLGENEGKIFMMDVCFNQPINQSTNQPINQSTNQPINQSTNQPINQSINKQ